jgi:hypothetical protein
MAQQQANEQANNYEFEKYVCTKETLQSTLEKYGVAVIPNVLNDEECTAMVSGMWDFFEHISKSWDTPLDRNNSETWRGFQNLCALHSMLVQHWGVGHAQASWDVRQNLKVVEIFAHFWGCDVEDLLVSFDGLSFHLPPEITNLGWNRGNTWYHTDQSFTKSYFNCVQSFVTGLDIEEHDATFSFMEGSHKFHAEAFEAFSATAAATIEKLNLAETDEDLKKLAAAVKDLKELNSSKDWYKLSPEQQDFYSARGCEIKNMKCPRGSMVFWDSRTMHCGIEASRKRLNPKLRAVIYLCYMPRQQCTAKNLKKKREALDGVDGVRTTTHHPCDVRLFNKRPRTYGKPIPEMQEMKRPKLNELGKKLAGF